MSFAIITRYPKTAFYLHATKPGSRTIYPSEAKIYKTLVGANKMRDKMLASGWSPSQVFVINFTENMPTLHVSDLPNFSSSTSSQNPQD